MLFLGPIILVDYSQEVSLLFQPIPVWCTHYSSLKMSLSLILKRQFICGCITESENNPL